MQRALANTELQERLARSSISGEWTGPEQSERVMKLNFEVFKNYSYLLKL
jgi:hypothetical protein